MVDRYTKVVLTVIALALVWLCLWGQVNVNITEVDGKRVRRISPNSGIPVEVNGRVDVSGSVTCN